MHLVVKFCYIYLKQYFCVHQKYVWERYYLICGFVLPLYTMKIIVNVHRKCEESHLYLNPEIHL